MSSSLLLQQCPPCLVCLTCIVFVMGGQVSVQLESRGVLSPSDNDICMNLLNPSATERM